MQTSYPDFGADAIAARATCGVSNLLILVRPDHPEFAAWKARINRLLQGDAPPELYLLTLNNLLSPFHLGRVGRRGKAAFALSILRAVHAQATQTQPVLCCALRLWEFSFQYWFEGDLERCLELAESDPQNRLP
jgi:hypothetical protein